MFNNIAFCVTAGCVAFKNYNFGVLYNFDPLRHEEIIFLKLETTRTFKEFFPKIFTRLRLRGSGVRETMSRRSEIRWNDGGFTVGEKSYIFSTGILRLELSGSENCFFV